MFDPSASLRVGLSIGLVQVDLAEMLPDAGEEVSTRAGGEQRELAGAGHGVGPRVGLAESAPLQGPGDLCVAHHLESRDGKLTAVDPNHHTNLGIEFGGSEVGAACCRLDVRVGE